MDFKRFANFETLAERLIPLIKPLQLREEPSPVTPRGIGMIPAIAIDLERAA